MSCRRPSQSLFRRNAVTKLDSEVLRRFRNEYGDEAAEKAARKLGYKSADAAIEKKSSPA